MNLKGADSRHLESCPEKKRQYYETQQTFGTWGAEESRIVTVICGYLPKEPHHKPEE